LTCVVILHAITYHSTHCGTDSTCGYFAIAFSDTAAQQPARNTTDDGPCDTFFFRGRGLTRVLA
jgi:hypothetical protein